jgi:hypothetical protein
MSLERIPENPPCRDRGNAGIFSNAPRGSKP